MNKIEGPSELVVPAQRYMSCKGCKYLKSQMIRSGRNPEHKNKCLCPPNDKEYSVLYGPGKEIPKSYDGYRIETPEWCPILKTKEDETEKH